MFSKLALTFLAMAVVAAPVAAQSARIVVVNGDPAGVGFNDPTPATPVGGNPGTTVGQQALNVFQTAANRWAANLQSKQPIYVIAFFTPLSCTATSAVLGAAAPNWYFANTTPANGGKALQADTWYPAALAEKLSRVDLTTLADPADPFEIFTFFNSNLGQPGCLTGRSWYYGLDNDQPADRVDLLAVVLHEFGHGLGVTVNPTNANTGARAGSFPSIWERTMLDLTTGKRWLDMTALERATSARNNLNLVWSGKQVTNAVKSTLEFGVEVAAAGVGANEAGPASFGPLLSRGAGVRGVLVAPADGGGVSPLDGCEPYPATASVAGAIVLVDRGTCTFNVKAELAQAAGAVAVVIANNAPGFLAPGGAAPLITIPVVGVTQAFGAALRGAAPVDARIALDSSNRQGTTAGYVRLFAPSPFQQGSSVSHFDTSLFPSVLMEPSITPDLTSRVKNPFDLTRSLLVDIGW